MGKKSCELTLWSFPPLHSSRGGSLIKWIILLWTVLCAGAVDRAVCHCLEIHVPIIDQYSPFLKLCLGYFFLLVLVWLDLNVVWSQTIEMHLCFQRARSFQALQASGQKKTLKCSCHQCRHYGSNTFVFCFSCHCLVWHEILGWSFDLLSTGHLLAFWLIKKWFIKSLKRMVNFLTKLPPSFEGLFHLLSLDNGLDMHRRCISLMWYWKLGWEGILKIDPNKWIQSRLPKEHTSLHMFLCSETGENKK